MGGGQAVDCRGRLVHPASMSAPGSTVKVTGVGSEQLAVELNPRRFHRFDGDRAGTHVHELGVTDVIAAVDLRDRAQELHFSEVAAITARSSRPSVRSAIGAILKPPPKNWPFATMTNTDFDSTIWPSASTRTRMLR